MRKKFTFLFITALAFLSFSCGDDLEKAFDCTGENVLLGIGHTTDAANSKKIDYKIEYTGNYAVESVKWTFGDGKTETINGSTVSHTYAAGGTFAVKADITIKSGSSSCTSEHSKSVTVN